MRLVIKTTIPMLQLLTMDSTSIMRAPRAIGMQQQQKLFAMFVSRLSAH